MSEVRERVRIVRAEPHHAVACVAISADWIDTTDWMPRLYADEAIECHIRDVVFAMRRTWVALERDEPVGFLALDIEGCVTALHVAAHTRGRGVGRMLLDTAKAEERALTLWTFAANEGACRFYAREGFTEVGGSDGDNEEGLPDVLLRWERGSGARTDTRS